MNELAEQFVRVRLTAIPQMDLRRFEFDCDLTWFVFFLNADETIYGRYGGRDAASADARLSLKGLHFAMGKALEAHRTPPPATKLEGVKITPESLAAGKGHKGCIHCHNVKEFQRADAVKAGTFTRESLHVYPPPENLGITLEVDRGNVIAKVLEGSAAAKAGLKPGQVLNTINGTPVSSFADATFALHKAPAKGTILIGVEGRPGDELRQHTLELAEGWKQSNLTWRPSLLDILPSLAFNAEELTAAEKAKLALDDKRAVFRQGDPVHHTLAKAGFLAGDIVIGFDGKTVNGSMGDLLGSARRNYLVGDTVAVDVIRNGKTLIIKLVLK